MQDDKRFKVLDKKKTFYLVQYSSCPDDGVNIWIENLAIKIYLCYLALFEGKGFVFFVQVILMLIAIFLNFQF